MESRFEPEVCFPWSQSSVVQLAAFHSSPHEAFTAFYHKLVFDQYYSWKFPPHYRIQVVTHTTPVYMMNMRVCVHRQGVESKDPITAQPSLKAHVLFWASQLPWNQTDACCVSDHVTSLWAIPATSYLLIQSFLYSACPIRIFHRPFDRLLDS